MFQECSSLANIDLNSFNTSNVTSITITGTSITNYSSMFDSALTDDNAYVIINYVSRAETIAQGMKAKITNLK